MTRQLDPWIDAEQRYAEDHRFNAIVCGLTCLLKTWDFTSADLRQALLVIERQEREVNGRDWRAMLRQRIRENIMRDSVALGIVEVEND